MLTLTDKYVNLFTDFGFKKVFAEEVNKDLLLDFLNELLISETGRIKDLTYLKTEYVGYTLSDRKSVFDIYCENENGEKFIVELQKTKQKFFKERALYYASLPIREQAQKNDWNFELKAVYVIAILDFVFDEDKMNANKFRYDVKLTDIETKKVFYDKLTFIYLEMPKFKKDITELNTRFEKWLFVIKNLSRLNNIPDELRERIFEKVFKTAEIARFTKSQLIDYEFSLKDFRDLQNSIDTAKEEGMQKGMQEGIEIGKEKGREEGIEIGKEKGREEGIEIGREEGRLDEKKQIAKKLLLNGLDVNEIASITGLSIDVIETIK